MLSELEEDLDEAVKKKLDPPGGLLQRVFASCFARSSIGFFSWSWNCTNIEVAVRLIIAFFVISVTEFLCHNFPGSGLDFTSH